MGIYNELDMLENEVAALRLENNNLIAENKELRERLDSLEQEAQDEGN